MAPVARSGESVIFCGL